MTALENLRKVREEKLGLLKKAGINPFPEKSSFVLSEIRTVLKDFNKIAVGTNQTALAGRIMAMRTHGSLTFLDLFDGTGKIQISLAKNMVGENPYKIFLETIDIGDFIAARGTPFLTKQNEPTINAQDWEVLAKALRPLPEKWHGLVDKEETLRKRYLDLIFNEDAREIVRRRAIFWNAVREYHVSNGFLEVETPVLENTTGGAAAAPFSTHHNALDTDVYLRISAGELWQKRLMVAGFNKTFEIGRIFRNEGMSHEHLQDYTQCEAYWAYADYKDMYEFLKDCYQFVAQNTFGTLKFNIGNFNVDLSGDWPLIDYGEEIKKQTGIDIWSANEKDLMSKISLLNIEYDARNRERLIDALWKSCRKNIGGPAVLINEPKIISPLAKSDPERTGVTHRFHFIIAGSEIGQGYSELNDPIDQRERFMTQEKMRQAGDKEAQMMDDDFVEALEYGMPPTAGHGFSERLFSFLSNKPIREAQIFPLMRPKK